MSQPHHHHTGAGEGAARDPVCGMRVDLLSPMLAAAAMSLSSVSVIANALRLRVAKL